jgi:hypothetical protein
LTNFELLPNVRPRFLRISLSCIFMCSFLVSEWPAQATEELLNR